MTMKIFHPSRRKSRQLDKQLGLLSEEEEIAEDEDEEILPIKEDEPAG